MPDKFLLISEASRLLGVAPATLRVWEADGKIGAVRTSGGVRLFDRRAVERLRVEREEAREPREAQR